MSLLGDLASRIQPARLSRRALELVSIPSPTGQTAEAAAYFAEQYRGLGCEVYTIEDIPAHPADYDAPSVAAYLRGGGGPTLQIDGHTDTIVMDHTPAEIRDGVLYGRGAVDMKGSVAAVMEVVNVLNDAGVQIPGTLLMTTHGSHEAPLGHGEGLRALIDAGHRGDAAIVVEGPVDELAIAGGGMTIWNVVVRGPAESTHENSTPKGTPHPLVGAGELVVALERERQRLAGTERPYVGCETLFVGQLHGGDFYNRFPTTATLQGTRRYFADHSFADVSAEFKAICDEVAARTGTRIEVEFDRVRDGYEVADDAGIVEAYRRGYRAVEGREIANSAFPSVGDVSVLAGEYGIPSVYCGSQGTGAHADLEVMPLAELERQTRLILGTILDTTACDSEGFDERKFTLRGNLLRLLGIPETHGDLAAESRGQLDLGDVVVEKWLIAAEPGSRIPVNLYRPAIVSDPIPAIVMTCGHGSSKGIPHMTYVARTYAKAGLACLMADPLGEEERHHEGNVGTRAHDARDVAYRCELAGRSVMGKFVFDAMRAIDFLETLHWIDSRRIGVTGNSLGGAVAGWLYGLESRLCMTIVSGWAFSDMLVTVWGKHCTRVPNRKLRAICDWREFLALGIEHGPLLAVNGDADVIIDSDSSATVWRDTEGHFAAVDPSGMRLRTWYCPEGGHRPYQGNKHSLRFIHEHLGTPALGADEIDALPELHYGTWCDEHGVELEKLYGTELHYRGAILPDFGFEPLDRRALAVLSPAEVGTSDFTIDGWLAACGTL